MHYALLMNMRKGITMAPHNASVSKAGVRGHVWLCAWPPRTETNKETFESAGGFMYITRKQKRVVCCVTGDRTVGLRFYIV